jgi:flagellar FliL protein
MAEENEEETTSTVDTGSAGKKNLIIIIVIVVVALGASIGGTLYALGFFESTDEEVVVSEGEEVTAAVEVDKPTPAIYFPIKPAFVVNFPSKGRQRYLQVDITVLTRDIAIFDAMQRHMPLIKNRLNMMMSGEIYEELQTDEGKELLRQKSLQALQEIMQAEVGTDGVEEVLFTNFVMQ